MQLLAQLIKPESRNVPLLAHVLRLYGAYLLLWLNPKIPGKPIDKSDWTGGKGNREDGRIGWANMEKKDKNGG